MENGRERFLSIQNHEKMEGVMRIPNLSFNWTCKVHFLLDLEKDERINKREERNREFSLKSGKMTMKGKGRLLKRNFPVYKKVQFSSIFPIWVNCHLICLIEVKAWSVQYENQCACWDIRNDVIMTCIWCRTEKSRITKKSPAFT